MFGHLKPSNLIGVLDGNEIPPRQARHLRNCAGCRRTLAELGEVHGDLAATRPDPLDHEMARIDWDGLRSSVRDALLARSVKRSSRVRRWTGAAIRPTAAWSLSLVLLVSAMTAGGFWHYRTDHGAPATALIPSGGDSPETANPLVDPLPDPVLAVFDSATGIAAGAVATEELAWPQTDLFSVLGQLEPREEELLRELIAEAAVENAVLDEGVPQ